MDNHYKTVLASLQKWGLLEPTALAYGSTLLISLAPFLILFLVRVENTPQHRNYLRIALSFASGGLLGDAFMHLIPHAMGGHSHDHEHDHEHSEHDHHEHNHEHDHAHDHSDHHHHDHHELEQEHGHSHVQQTYVGLYIVAGIVLFFLIEMLIQFIKGEGHGHSHSHAVQKKGNKKAKVSDDDSDEELIDASKKKRKSQTKVSKTRVVSGLLNLIADFLHNFTDGLAIGATFAAGKSMGLITALTIFAHEIPHEIGDYAILIQAGYKRRSAMGLQLVTAIGALIGTAVGLHYGTLEHATQLILPITAGGFIYIATVSILPELLEKTGSYLQTLFEFIAMFTGLAMMFWIALYE